MSEHRNVIRRRIQELAKAHGSLRRLAEAIHIDPGYLSRLQDGEKYNPSDELLRRLGLRKVITYVRIAP